MTPYTAKDLAEDWEFKILRSATGRFRNPLWLRAVLEEEARAGWILVEKIDDARVRLKRPSSALAGDAASPFDPRRTWVGMRPGHLAMLIVFGMAAVLGFVALGVLFARSLGLR